MYEPRLVFGNFFRRWEFEIIPGSVDLVLTDPPYNLFSQTRLAGDLPFDDKIDLFQFEDIMDEILKPNGLIVVFCNLNLFFKMMNVFECFVLWHELILSKTSGNFTCKTQPIRTHEYIAVFRRKESAPSDLFFNPYAGERKGNFYIKKNVKRLQKTRLTGNPGINIGDPAGRRWLRSVIDSPSRPNLTAEERSATSNPFQKPEVTIRLLIDTYSRINDLILDPFAGSSVVLICAQDLNRRSIGFEKHTKYYGESMLRLKKVNDKKLVEGWLFVHSN